MINSLSSLLVLIQIQPPSRIGHPSLGIILPGLILALSFVLTYALIRYFSKEHHRD